MNTISITLNGKKVTCEPGLTIMQVANNNGIHIPHLCHATYLEPSSACRICVVEVEGARALMPSCSVKVTDGMIVKTHTERILSARRTIIELLLSAHPQDCLTCEKTGDCKLQQYAYNLGVKESPYPWASKYDFPVFDDNAFYIRDYNKCILCGRCIRVCDEVQGNQIIDFAKRGFDTRVSTPMNRDLKESGCVFCGNCVASCPVGALTEKASINKGRLWELDKTTTTCPYCGCGCQLVLHVKDNKVLKVAGDKKAAVNGIALCVKGRFGIDYVNNHERLTKPLLRKEDGTFAPISWSRAISIFSERIKAIRETNGAHAIGGLSSAKCTNEENYLFQKLMRAAVGTNNVDHCARLCHASTVSGLNMSFGSGAMTNTIADIEKAETIVITGSNTTEAHPIIGLSVKKAVARGSKLIVVEPRAIPLTKIADMHLSQRPGTDVAWINGMMNVIIAEGLADKSFIESRTENYEEMAKVVEKYTPEHVEEITGIPADRLREAARAIAKSSAVCFLYSMGITQHTTGTDNVVSVANLAMLTGNIGKPGAGVCPLRGQNNVQGSCDMGALPGLLPGYQSVADPDARKKYEDAWGVTLPEDKGLTVIEMMRAAHSGDLKALIVMGENPMLSDPDLAHVEEGLKNLEFLVVQDIFLTETARLAHLVLPAASFAEKDGTFTNTERRVQRVRKAMEPVGASLADWEILGKLSKSLGYPLKYRNPDAVMKEIAKLTPIYGGVDYKRLDGDGLHWPCRTPKDPGTPILHKETFTRGKGKFHAVEFREPAERTDAEYPMILTTGRVLYHFHTGSMTRRSEPINEHMPTGFIEINPEDAAALGIANEGTCRVTSRRGEISVRACVTSIVPKGTVFLPFHFQECAANILTNPVLDPIALIPEFKVCAVRVVAV